MALSVAQCGGSCRSSIPSSSHLLCTSSQHCGGHGCVSSLPLLARLRPDVERLLLLKNGDRLVQQQLPVSASRMMKQASPRFRLSAVAELQSIGRGGGGVVADEFEKVGIGLGCLLTACCTGSCHCVSAFVPCLSVRNGVSRCIAA
jgi:hypothetical protein